MSRSEITFSSKKLICEVSRSEKTTLRLQYGQWGDNELCYDLRTWYVDKDGNEKCGKGITLSTSELALICKEVLR